MNTTSTIDFSKPPNQDVASGMSASKWTQPKQTTKKFPSTSQSRENRSKDTNAQSKYTPLVAVSKQHDDSQLMDIRDIKGTTTKEK